MKKPREKRQAWSPDSEFIYAQNRIEKACPENQPTLRAFAEWLREERDLSPAAVTIRLGTACTFVDEITDRVGAPCVRQAFESASFKQLVQGGEEAGQVSRRADRVQAVKQYETGPAQWLSLVWRGVHDMSHGIENQRQGASMLVLKRSPQPRQICVLCSPGLGRCLEPLGEHTTKPGEGVYRGRTSLAHPVLQFG